MRLRENRWSALFFYWLGFDSSFADQPKLLQIKKRLESDIEHTTRLQFSDFKKVEARALVFLDNRRALADGSATEPRYLGSVRADIRSSEHPELNAEALNNRLQKIFHDRAIRTSVTRWKKFEADWGNVASDLRLGRAPDGLFFSYYAGYVAAIRDPKDLRFVKFLVDGGLAETWNAKDAFVLALENRKQP